jgi:hypothetical protein
MLALPTMSQIVGTVHRSDLEGGHWILETENGERYQLHGELGDLQDGMRARVQGTVERGMMGIGMTGPSFTVEKVTPLDSVRD